MASGRLDTQVIVVGAGPVGLMLAGELRLGGADVIVLERRDTPTTESRASTLHARTMEILDSRGLLGRLGTPPRELRGHFGGIQLDLTLPGPYPGQWKVPQTQLEALLQEWVTDQGADLRRGHEVRVLTVGEDYVEVETATPGGPVRLRAQYVVGCDGQHSTVRGLAEADFPGEDAHRELLRADVAGVDIPNRRFERLEKGLAIAVRREDGVTRVMVHEFGRIPEPRTGEPEFAEFAESWKRVTGEEISGGTPLWINSFDDANRQLTRYLDRRVLFAGDAAHQQMPIGGQALNLGLQDAVNLGWKLALHVGGTGPDDLLDSYHTERHAIGRQVLSNIRAQAMLLLGDGAVEPVRTLLSELIAIDEVREHLARMISGLDIRHDVGDGYDPLLGVRLPHAALATGRGASTTTALLRTGQGVLLDLSGDAGRNALLRQAAGPWADRVTTVAAGLALASSDGPLRGIKTILIRPDGHIAWTGAEVSGLTDPLHRWFGRPAAAKDAEK